MNKKMFCTLLIVISIASNLAPVVQAALTAKDPTKQYLEGVYPPHDETITYVEQENSLKDCWTDSVEAFVFEVGGKSFILLDKDTEGNYFVMVEGEYGKHAADMTYVKQPAIATAPLTGGANDIVSGSAYSVEDALWSYNPEDKDNIGYWLNHDFLEKGNGGDYVLPNEIKENLIEKQWVIENYAPILAYSVRNLADTSPLKVVATNFISNRARPKYTVGGKLSLMSYTEYKVYQELIGFKFCDKGWNGFMLRTPYSLTTYGPVKDAPTLHGIFYKFGGMQVRNRKNEPTSDTMIIVGNDTPDEPTNFYVKPVMWLSKDFFANVKVNLVKIGVVPKNEILKHSIAELSGVYNDAELTAMGYDMTDLPEVKNQSLLGTPAAGSALVAKYEYISPKSVQERNTEISWFYSDAPNGKYKAIGQTGSSYVIDDELTGKFIKCRMMATDVNGKSGKFFWSAPTAAVKVVEMPQIKEVNITDTNASIKVANETGTKKIAKLIVGVYDGHNQLISVLTQETALESGAEDTLSLAIPPIVAGQHVNVMVWADRSQPIFLLGK